MGGDSMSARPLSLPAPVRVIPPRVRPARDATGSRKPRGACYSPPAYRRALTAGDEDTVRSVLLPDLTVEVSGIFPLP